jgi:hypothetical protein
MKIANRDARKYVQRLDPFQGSNIYAQMHQPNPGSPASWYVIYSYGAHWPLFVYADGVWYENEDRYSPTTSKHRGQVHPHQPTTLLPCEKLLQLVHRDGGSVPA